MSSTTPNIGLTKTTAAETIGQNWAASNDSGGNFDIIDTKMGAVGNTSLQAQVTALNSNIGNRLNIAYDGSSTPNQKFTNAPVGFSVVSVIAGKEGNPTSTGGWIIMQFKTDSTNQYGVQIAFQTNSSQLYLRRLYAGTWSGWTLIGGN